MTLGRLVLSNFRCATEFRIGLEVTLDAKEKDPIGGRGFELRVCGFSLCYSLVAWR